MALFAAIGCSVMIFVAVFPREVLWVLGPAYAGLTYEVTLSIACSASYFMTVTALAMANARGIVISPWFGIGLNLAVQLILVCILNVHTVRGVLWFGILVSTFDMIVCWTNFLIVSQRSDQSSAAFAPAIAPMQ